MKNLLILGVMLPVLISLTGCKSKEIQSKWTGEEILVDGIISEWESFPIEYFENPRIHLSAVNNADNLYVRIGFADQALAGMFMRTGITLWFDKNAKKKKLFGLRYRAPVSAYRRASRAIDPMCSTSSGARPHQRGRQV